MEELTSSNCWTGAARTHRVLSRSTIHPVFKRQPAMADMRSLFSLLLLFFAVLLAPTGAWAASVSQNLSITITPATQSVSLTPASLAFASQNIGTSSPPQTVTMTNTGSVSFLLSSIAITGTNASDFSQTNNCPSSLAVSGSCQISVIFTPTAAGTRTASLVELAAGGGTYNVSLGGIGATPPPPPAAAFYVATNGSDSNAGTFAAPFATFLKCASAMRSSSTKLCYVRAGTYDLTATPYQQTGDPLALGCATYCTAVYLTSADAGETFSYYPPDGYNTAILDGGATIVNCRNYATCTTGNGNGMYALFGIGGSANPAITFNGLQFQRFGLDAVIAYDSPVIFTNNIVHDGMTGSEFGGGGGAIMVASNSLPAPLTATHNYCYNMQGMCTENIVSPVSNVNANITGAVVSYNFAQNVCQNLGDCGCYYFGEESTVATSTNISVTYNYCRDVYKPIGQGMTGTGNQGVAPAAGMCIYMDATTSNTTVEYNVCTGQMGWFFQYHGGINNTVKYNILDAGSSSGPSIYYAQAEGDTFHDQGTGNVFSNNIIVENNAPSSAAGGYSFWYSESMPPILTQNNLYYNYSNTNYYVLCNPDQGCSPTTGSDRNYVTGTNPLIHCWGAIFSPNTTVGNSPVSFPTITAQPADYDTPGFWGPPGFTVTHTGTAPSWPTTSGDGVTCTSTN